MAIALAREALYRDYFLAEEWYNLYAIYKKSSSAELAGEIIITWRIIVISRSRSASSDTSSKTI